MSVLSSCSVESDWSDEELEELEKMFGDIQHKSSMAENCPPEFTADFMSLESLDSAKWKDLKKSKKLAMNRVQQQQQQKGLRHSVSSSSLTSSSKWMLCHYGTL